MGTPWAIRRMLAGVKIVTTYEHAAGGSLSERAVSSAGEGAPNTILLDGVAHPTKIGGRDATVCAVERPEAGVVRIETTLPGGAGHIVDERRVLGGGGELERTIELTLEGKPPIKLHRLLVRTPESAPPQRWVGAGSSPPAGDSVTVEVVVPLPPPPPLARRSLLRREAHVTARFVLAEGTSWADAGHEVSAEQFAVPPPPPPREAIVTKPEPPPLVVEESADALVVRGGEGGAAFRISIGKASGAIDEWIVGGRRLVLGGSARPALWRAPTDNDNGGAMNSLPRPHKAVLAGSHMVWWLWIGFWLMWNGLIYGQLSYADTWRREGLHAMRPRRRAVSVGVAGPHAVELCVASELSGDPTAEAPAPRATAAPADDDGGGGGARATHSLRVRVHSDGEVVLLSETTVSAECPSLPRVGLAFELSADLGAVGYYGRGPHENYPDRCDGARLAEFSTSVDALLTPYLVPSECGYRTGARWVELTDGSGAGVRVAAAGAPFGFSALRHDAAALDAAAHPHELQEAVVPCTSASTRR